jgi:hypothetical protein
MPAEVGPLSLDEAFAKLVSEKEAKVLRPAASQVAAATREYGFIDIYVAPTVDALIAGSIAASVFQKNNVRYSVTVTLIPPKTLERPSLLIGYPSSLAEELSARRPSALIGVGEQPTGIMQVQVAATNDSSVSALTVAVLSEVAIVGPIAAYAIAAAYWRGLDRGKKAEFQGFERTIIELLKLENRVEEQFTVRLMRWNVEPTEEALYLTLDPYLPGLTGNREGCVKFLAEDPRLAQLRGKTVSEASEQALTVLGAKLYDLIKQSSRVPRRPSEIIGYAYFYKEPLVDLREAALALAYYAETVSPYALLSLAVVEKAASSAAYHVYARDYTKIVSHIERARNGLPEKRRLGRLDLVVLPEKPPSILLADRILRKLGVINTEQILAYKCNGSLCSNIELMLQRHSYQQVVELLESKCITPAESEVEFNVRIQPASCS